MWLSRITDLARDKIQRFKKHVTLGVEMDTYIEKPGVAELETSRHARLLPVNQLRLAMEDVSYEYVSDDTRSLLDRKHDRHVPRRPWRRSASGCGG